MKIGIWLKKLRVIMIKVFNETADSFGDNQNSTQSRSAHSLMPPVCHSEDSDPLDFDDENPDLYSQKSIINDNTLAMSFIFQQIT